MYILSHYANLFIDNDFVFQDRNFSVPISTNWNIRNGYVEGEGPSQCFQEVRETVIREIGSCEQNVSANPENTDTAFIIPDELGEFFALVVLL